MPRGSQGSGNFSRARCTNPSYSPISPHDALVSLGAQRPLYHNYYSFAYCHNCTTL
jgi:hypothetical protein